MHRVPLLVIGSSNTDMTVHLPALPSPGQTVLGGSLLRGPGGKGANQAVAAARAGGDVTFITAIGDDPFGRESLDAHHREGIDVSHTRIFDSASSGVALIFLDAAGENMIGVAPGANSLLTPAHIKELPDHLFHSHRLLLLAGLELPLDAVLAAAERGKSSGMQVVLNPAPFLETLPNSPLLSLIDVLTPNRIELAQLTGINTATHRGAHHAAVTLTKNLPALSVVVTLGGRGSLVLDKIGESSLIPARSVRAVDTVGAGDAFNGALAVALAEGLSLCESARWATNAAALAVSAPGAQSSLPLRPDIDRLAASPS